MNWDSPGRKIRKKVVIDGITYNDSEIIEIEINESIIEGSTLSLGSAVATQATLKLRTKDSIGSNAKVEPYVCLESEGVLTAWVKLATVYIDDRTVDNNIYTFNCYDKLYLAQKQYNMYSNIMHEDKKVFLADKTLKDIAQDIARIIGVTLDSTFPLDESIDIRYLPSYTATVRDILGSVAGIHGACAKINRSGVLSFIDFSNSSIKKTYDRADYSECMRTNDDRNITYAEVYTNRQDNYTIGNVTVPENAIEVVSDFMEGDIDSIVRNKLSNYSYTPIALHGRGDPNLKIGDRISVKMRDGNTVNSIILSNRLIINKGLQQEIEAPSTINISEFGRFSIYEEIQEIEKEIEKEKDRTDEFIDIVDEELELNLDKRDKLYTFTISGNAIEGEHFTISVQGDHPLNALPWYSFVTIRNIDEPIYINNSIVNRSKSYRIKKDIQLSITTDASGTSKIWIETFEPTDEGKDGDIWLVVGGDE